MVIRKLRVVNVKRLRDATFVPPEDAALVVVAGKNDNGKSSALDSICMVLGGAKFDPPEPIRRGEARATAEIDLGSFKVKCVWTPNGRRLEVVDKADPDGKVSAPQTFLDRLVGPLSFDPLAFSRDTAPNQVKVLADLLGIDFAQANAARAEAVTEHTAAQKARKEAERRAEELGEAITDFSLKEVSLSELATELQVASQAMADRDALCRDMVETRVRAEDTQKRVEELTSQLNAETANLLRQQVTADECATKVGNTPVVDVQAIRNRLTGAEEHNAKARKVAEYEALVAAVETGAAEAETAQAKVDRIDAWKKKKLAEAPFPIEGLAFAEDGSGILLGDVPFEQAGDAAKIKVGVAIGLALSKEVKVILIRDGSLLDDDSMDAIEAMAEEAKAQVWCERVGTEGPATWVIDDGAIMKPEARIGFVDRVGKRMEAGSINFGPHGEAATDAVNAGIDEMISG
jgi:hypothetical protein